MLKENGRVNGLTVNEAISIPGHLPVPHVSNAEPVLCWCPLLVTHWNMTSLAGLSLKNKVLRNDSLWFLNLNRVEI